MADFLSQPSSRDVGTQHVLGFESCDFREFHDRHYDFVRRNLRRLGLSDAMADDGTQEVFLRLHAKIDDYRGEAPERAWVYGFVRRVAALMRRTEARRDRKHRAMYEAATPLAGADRGGRPPEATEQLVVDEMLEKLDAHDREVLVLVDVEGVSGPELAAMQGIELNRAYHSIRMARRRARAALEQVRGQPQLQSAMLSPALLALLQDPASDASLAPLLGKTLGTTSSEAARNLAWTKLMAAEAHTGLGLATAATGAATGALPPLVVKTLGVGLGIGLGLGIGVGTTAVVDGILEDSNPAPVAAVGPESVGASTHVQPASATGPTQRPVQASAEPTTQAVQPTERAHASQATEKQGPRVEAKTPRTRRRSTKQRVPEAQPDAGAKSKAVRPANQKDVRLDLETRLIEQALRAYDEGRHHQVIVFLDRADRELGPGSLALERKALRRRSQCHIDQARGVALHRRCDQLSL